MTQENTDTTTVNLDELQKYWNEKAKHQNGACPNCGYCPHCGRGGYGTQPLYPMYPIYPQPYYPHYGPTLVVCGPNTM